MKIIEELTGLVSNKINAFKALATLVKLESSLAVQSVLPLVLSICIFFALFTSFAIALMALITYLSFMLLDSFLYAMLVAVLVTAVCMLGLLKYILFNVHNMSFEKTRNYFKEENEYALKKRLNSSNRAGRKKITPPPVRGV